MTHSGQTKFPPPTPQSSQPPLAARQASTGTADTSKHPQLARNSQCCAVVGLQWGDEGKGKVVDVLTPGFDAIVRYNGGANAGHSVVVQGQRYALHLLPSGIMHPGKLAIIGNGVVIDPEVVLKEVDGLSSRGVDCSGLVVSSRAHVVFPYHKAEDELREAMLSGSASTTSGGAVGSSKSSGAIGTTKRGIGPCYADKAHRATAIRAGDLIRPELMRSKLALISEMKNAMFAGMGGTQRYNVDELMNWAVPLGKKLAPSIRDTTYLLHDLLGSGKRLLFEGANAALLDVDHGTHPYVTSSSTTVLGIPAGTGVPGARISEVLGVMKAYSTRVGNGPLPTEQINDIGQGIRERGREYGTTTGRPRRVGWLDLVAVRYSAMLNGVTGLALMLLDVLAGIDELKVCTGYRIDGVTTDRFPVDGDDLSRAEPIYATFRGFADDVTGCRKRAELPQAAAEYVDLIERLVGVRVQLVSVGPDRVQTMIDG